MRFKPLNLILVVVMAMNCLASPAYFSLQANDLKAVPLLKPEDVVTAETQIAFQLNRALTTEEKLAVTIGKTDVTSLLTQAENRFVYDPKFAPLPVGNTEVTVFLTLPNGDWKEIGRFPLVVTEKPAVAVTEPEVKIDAVKTDETKPETPTVKTTETPSETQKTRKFRFLPSFTIGMKSQPSQSNFPLSSRPEERATFNDFTLTGSIKTEAKAGIFSSDSSFDFAGSTFKPETLQFGTLAREAPDVDLASYLVNAQIGGSKFSLGHTSLGNNRHLVSGFSSRGLSVTIPISKRFDVSAGVLNGTSLLGVGNFFGVAKIRHQVQGATLGIEFFPKRAGAMRIEITGFNGYLQALNGVSEGRIVDAEQSRGIGLRFVTTDKSERFKLEYGFALSRFFNPQDTTLDPDGNAIALPAVSRTGHYAESSFQFLKDLAITKTRKLNLNFAFKYEYVEPLFRSLGASASADKFNHDYSFDGSLGDITFAYGHSRTNDNLRNVPSILKSLTRSNRFTVALPLAGLFGASEKPSPFLPRLGYSFDRTLQTAAGIPVNGGFEIDIATIPDLLNTNQAFNAAWQFGKVNLDYAYSRSFADNRQTGREIADQLGWTHGVTFALTPITSLSFNVGLNFESSKDVEAVKINRTNALTFGANWTPFKGATFTSDFSQTLSGDAARTNRNRGINYSAQFAYTFSREKSQFRKVGFQTFIRFADTFARNRDFVAVTDNLTRTKIVTAGMTVNFF